MTREKDENSIFRAEALQHKQEGWFGLSRLHIPSSLSLCLITGLITCSFIVSIIALGQYSERVNVTGTVVYDPPAVSLMAQSDGMITTSSALEGAVIKRGKPIFSVSGDVQTTLGSIHFEIVALLKKQRDALSKKIDSVVSESKNNSRYLTSKINNKEQEIESLERLIKDLKEQKEWFEKKSNLYASFRSKGMVLDSDIIDRKRDYYLAAERLSSLKVKIVTLQGELLDLKKQVGSIDRELGDKIESFNIDIAGIDQKILDAEKNKEHFIVAPFDGVITSVTAHQGERVTAGQQIAVLVPQNAAAKIELLSPSDSLGEVVRGQRVKMRVAAYPYQWYGKIPGVIETISAAPINMISLVQEKSDHSVKRLFRITVRPELAEQKINISLLSGMEVETEIYVKTRKVYEWLFIPVKRAYERAMDSLE